MTLFPNEPVIFGTQRIKKIPRVILGLPCLTVNMIYMNLEVPFHWELEHRLLTIISHLILLLASCLMFWRLCPAVSFSVAGFSRYSSVFSLYPVVTGFSRYSSLFSLILWVHSDWLFCYVVISPERAYPGPFLVVTCCGGGVVAPPPLFYLDTVPSARGKILRNIFKGGREGFNRNFCHIEISCIFLISWIGTQNTQNEEKKINALFE